MKKILEKTRNEFRQPQPAFFAFVALILVLGFQACGPGFRPLNGPAASSTLSSIGGPPNQPANGSSFTTPPSAVNGGDPTAGNTADPLTPIGSGDPMGGQGIAATTFQNRWKSLSAPIGYSNLRLLAWDLSDMVYAVGAFSSGEVRIIKYSLEDDVWYPVTNVPAGALPSLKNVFFTGDKLLCYSSELNQNSSNDYSVSTYGWTYDIKMQSWKELSKQNWPSGVLDQLVYWGGGKLYVVGGTSYPGYVGTSALSIYNLASDSWSKSQPFTGSDISSSAGQISWVADKLFAFQFVNASASKADPQSHVYSDPAGAYLDPVREMWFPLSMKNAPSTRLDSSILQANGIIVVFGGTNVSQSGGTSVTSYRTVADGGIYDTKTDSWKILPSAKFAGRMHSQLGMIGGKLIVYGGYSGKIADNGNYHLDQWLRDGAFFDLASGSWSDLATIPELPDYSTTLWTSQQMFFLGNPPNGGAPVFFALY